MRPGRFEPSRSQDARHGPSTRPGASDPGGGAPGRTARRQWAAGPFDLVDLEVEHVVEHDSRRVEHHRGGQQGKPFSGSLERPLHEQPAGQAIGRGGDDVRQPDQLKIGRDRLAASANTATRGAVVDRGADARPRGPRRPRDRGRRGTDRAQRSASRHSRSRGSPRRPRRNRWRPVPGTR